MNLKPARRRIAHAALTGLVMLAVAHPAFAQSTGVGGNIGTFIQNIVDLITGGGS